MSGYKAPFEQALAIAAWAGYRRYSSLLSGNPSPRQRADLERISNPVVGDLVVEVSSLSRIIGWERYKSLRQAIGILIERPEKHLSFEDTWVIRSLEPTPRETNWTNCDFIMIETPPILPLCEHCNGTGKDCPKERVPFHPDNATKGYCASGRWVYPLTMTKASLTDTLEADGFSLKK